MRVHIAIDVSTGDEVTTPFSADEEQAADAADADLNSPSHYALTRRQVRRAIAYSIGLDAVTAAIMALPAGQVRDLALVDWEDSPVYVRAHPLFNQLSAVIGITPAEIDALWLWAVSFDA